MARRGPLDRRWLVGLAGFVAVIAVLLFTEHRAHALGALPYLLLLACPFMHFFMHRGHDHHTGARRTS